MHVYGGVPVWGGSTTALPAAVPRTLVPPHTPFTERKRDGTILFAPHGDKTVKIRIKKKIMYEKFMEAYVGIENESVKCFHEQHSFGAGKLRVFFSSSSSSSSSCYLFIYLLLIN